MSDKIQITQKSGLLLGFHAMRSSDFKVVLKQLSENKDYSPLVLPGTFEVSICVSVLTKKVMWSPQYD